MKHDAIRTEAKTSSAVCGSGRVGAFALCPGRVYELRIALRARTGTALRETEMGLRFLDRHGVAVDPDIVGAAFTTPHLNPLRIETLPAAVADAPHALDAALASRFLIAPPDAALAEVTLAAPGVEAIWFEAAPLAINWPRESKKMLEELRKALDAQAKLLARRLPAHADDEEAARVRAMAVSVPIEQAQAIAQQFSCGQGWATALADIAEAAGDGRGATALLAAAQSARPRIGFIGGERTFRRLDAFSDVILLREDDWRAQIAGLPLEGVVIETTPENVLGDWRLAFGRLGGAMDEPARALFTEAARRGVPVRMLVTACETEAPLYQEAFDRADAVVIEGLPAEWRRPPDGAIFLPRAIEPALMSPGSERRAERAILCPCGSDAFQDAAFREMLKAISCRDLLVTEFDYGFVAKSLRNLLDAHCIAHVCAGFGERAALLRRTSTVLLTGRSLRGGGGLETAAIDAIAAGAIPVVFRGPRKGEGLLGALEHVETAEEFLEVERLHRIGWVRERAWRRLFRLLCREHVWTSAHRAALVGHDPCPPDFDAPLVTNVIVSKRPQNIDRSLATFRAQTHARSELIFVFNSDHAPDTLPPLRSNEQFFIIPENRNIGYCLNLGIAHANGVIWTKMDDDDYYSDFYNEDLVNIYRATQADIVGRQSIYFYMSGEDTSYARSRLEDRMMQRLQDDWFISGATLSGRKDRPTPPFSHALRNAVDSEWVKEARRRGLDMFSFDATSMVVYRDADPAAHTWIRGPAADPREFRRFCAGNAHAVFDRSPS